jgi:hypothetical protein
MLKKQALVNEYGYLVTYAKNFQTIAQFMRAWNIDHDNDPVYQYLRELYFELCRDYTD